MFHVNLRGCIVFSCNFSFSEYTEDIPKVSSDSLCLLSDYQLLVQLHEMISCNVFVGDSVKVQPM